MGAMIERHPVSNSARKGSAQLAVDAKSEEALLKVATQPLKDIRLLCHGSPRRDGNLSDKSLMPTWARAKRTQRGASGGGA
jgi:hypothetical protein